MAERPTLVVAISADDQKRIEAGGQYVAKDSLDNSVSQFCKKHGVPCNTTFVCIGVFDGEVPQNNLIRLYSGSIGSLGKKGVLAHLKHDKVLGVVEVVADGDFQDIASHGYKADANPRDSSKRYLKLIQGVTGDDAQRRTTLLKAAHAVANPKYAEARMFCPLVKEFIEKYEDA